MDQIRDRWRAVVNTVMNFQVTYKAENLLISGAVVSASQERTLLHAVSFILL
jgi:hypothetical protein